MTALLTVLIWAAADSLVREVGAIEVALKPVPMQPSMIVDLDPQAYSVRVQFSGPRRFVESIRDRGPLTLQLPIPDQPTGNVTVSLNPLDVRRQLAERWTEFDRMSVTSVQPDSVPILIDHYRKEEVQLVIKKSTLAFEAEPRLQRASATARLRDSFLNMLAPDQALQYDLTPDLERMLKDQPIGQTVTLSIPLDAKRIGPNVELTPSSVEVTVTIKADRVTESVPTVPVLVTMSFANLGRPIRAANRDGAPQSLVTLTIKVRGLASDVQKLMRGETRAYGMIHLKEDDLQQLNTVKLLVPDFHLPPGIELAEEPPPVELQLLPVSEPTPERALP